MSGSEVLAVEPSTTIWAALSQFIQSDDAIKECTASAKPHRLVKKETSTVIIEFMENNQFTEIKSQDGQLITLRETKTRQKPTSQQILEIINNRSLSQEEICEKLQNCGDVIFKKKLNRRPSKKNKKQ